MPLYLNESLHYERKSEQMQKQHLVLKESYAEVKNWMTSLDHLLKLN